MVNIQGKGRKKTLVNIYNTSFAYSIIGMLVVLALELFMLSYTFINPALYGQYIWLYRAFYIALLFAAILYMVLNQWVKNDIERRYTWLVTANPLFAVLFFAWALGVTCSDAIITGTADTSVFMTFSMLLPLCFYMTPQIYGLIAALADAVIIGIVVVFSGGMGRLINLSIFVIFQLLFGISFLLLKTRLAERIIQEQENAHIDVMTGFGNRRAYVSELDSLSNTAKMNNLTYIAIDVNGLKDVNDQFGHDAGDKLIVGAAQCIEHSFGEKGKLFRTGGDEFVVLTTAEDLEERFSSFRKCMDSWSVRNQLELSASYGWARCADYPNIDIEALAKAADDKMYQAKALHYEQVGKERRKRQPVNADDML